MKDSFTIDELREFFESNVINSDRHGNGYYTTLDGVCHSTDVGYFEKCMPYFLQDLQYHLDEINKPEVELNRAINSYYTVKDALNNLYKHISGYIYNITIAMINKENAIRTCDYISCYYNIKEGIGDALESDERSWLNNKYFNIQYLKNSYTLVIIIIN